MCEIVSRGLVQMNRLLCDEDVHGDLIRTLAHRCPEWELIRVQDIGLGGEDHEGGDPAVLEYAAENGLVVLTQDRSTMRAHANARLVSNLAMPGLIVVKARTSLARVVEEIRLLVEIGPESWDNPVMFVPIR
jgi:predicted nuclease of predicted toxin-antitoxin system